MGGSVARALLAHVGRRRPDLLDFVGELVAIPSHVSQPEGLERIGDLMAGELRRLGFVADSDIAGHEERAPAWAEAVLSPEVPYEALRRPTVWRRKGIGEPVLVLGDLDAALVTPSSACRLRIDGERAIGPAVADMKGGLAILVAALDVLADEAIDTPPLTIVLSEDEQAGSLRSRGVIERLGADARWAVCLECARDGGRLMRSRAHIGVGELRAIGREGHAGSSRDFVNPIAALARALVALDEAGVSGPDGTSTPTILRAGRRRSLVPAAASAVLDVRAANAEAWDALAGRMRGAVASSGGQALVLELFSHRPGLPRTARTDRFLALVAAVGDEIGLQIEAQDSLAAGSSAFLDSEGAHVLDGMGPAGGDLMTDREYVEIDSLVNRTALLAGTIARICSNGMQP